MRIIYNRPPLASYQKAILDSPKRYTVTVASTKSGKTASHIVWLFEMAITNNSVRCWWVAPIVKQAQIAYKRIKNELLRLGLEALIKKFYDSKGSQSITFINGSVIEFNSADRPDGLYGENVHYVVCDEFTRFSEAAWIAIRSTITNTRGKCKFIGNVTNRGNWGYKLLQQMKDHPEWETFTITALDAVEQGIMAIEEFEDARQSIPEVEFKALYLCEPVDNGTNPFNYDRIAECTVDKLSTFPVKCYGIDIASTHDYTVICGLDGYGQVCYHQRFQGDYNQIQSIIETLPAGNIVIDSTGVGKPVYDYIRMKRRVTPFQFNQSSRQSLLTNLASGIHKLEIKFQKNYADCLSNFIVKEKEIGYTYISQAKHDDETMALALAYWGITKTAQTYALR